MSGEGEIADLQVYAYKNGLRDSPPPFPSYSELQ